MTSLTKIGVLAGLSVLLASCSTELFDQNYAPYPSEFDPGNGVVTIFRESHFVGGRTDALVSVGPRQFGNLPNGSGLRIGLPPGQSVIQVHTALFHDELSIPITVEPGREYYVAVAAQANAMFTMGVVPYMLSQLKANVKQYCNSSWCADVEDEAVAQPKLQKITMRERVRKSSF